MSVEDPPDLELRNVRVGLGGELGCVRLVADQVVDIKPTASPDAVNYVDCDGRTLLPGMRDMHVHMAQWASVRDRIDLSGAGSAQDAAEIVLAAKPDRSGVVIGYGFRDASWPAPPHKDILERALPGVATMLLANDLHTAWLSPAALARAGMGEHPTGVLVEQEAYRPMHELARTDIDRLDRRVADATAAAAQRGVTEVLDFEYSNDLAGDWLRRAKTHGIRIRVRCAIRVDFLADAISRGLRTGDVVSDGISIGPVKMFADGSLNTRTALCDVSYPDTSDNGSMELNPDELRTHISTAAANGLEPAIHAIGDRANTMVLDAFEDTGQTGRIEHAQLVNPSDLARFARLGVIASVQPAHQPDDRDVADLCWPTLSDHAYPYASLLVAGATLEFGSDAPVAPLDPWDGIASAVTRTDDDRPAWHPEQALTVEQAIAASCGGRTTINVGDVADLTIVDEDPLAVAAADLRDMPVHATMVAGRWTFQTT